MFKLFYVNGFTNVEVNKVYAVYNQLDFTECMKHLKGTIKEITYNQAEKLVESGIQFDQVSFAF